MEERGTMGEIKSLALVISGGDGRSSPKKNLGLCKKKSQNVAAFQRKERCVKELWKCSTVV